MHDAQHLARLGQISDPGVPRSVTDPVSEAGKNESDDEDGIRGMQADDDVGKGVTGSADDADATLAYGEVEIVVENGGGDITDKRGEEYEGYDSVV